MVQLIYDIANNPYSPFVLVFGLIFVIPSILKIAISTIPELIMDYTGIFTLILLPSYMIVSFIFISLAIIVGLINAIIIMFSFMEIMFKIFG